MVHSIVLFAARNPGWAAVVAAATTSLLYFLRHFPEVLWKFVVSKTTLTLDIGGAEEAYRWVDLWLDRRCAESASTFKLKSDKRSWRLVPGFGAHLFWDRGPVLVRRTVVKDDDDGPRPFKKRNDSKDESISITILGRDRRRLDGVLSFMEQSRDSEDGAVDVWVWLNEYWSGAMVKVRREISSIVMPPEQREEVVGHTKWFIENRKWYSDRSVPYRLGYLLTGPPGTGKTSLVMALACYFKKDIYILNLSSVLNDTALQGAFNGVKEDDILLIEDIDAMDSAASRDGDSKNEVDDLASVLKRGVTLSGLLNAIDGVASSEGRILVMTTNHPEKLDPALVRKARIDKTWEIRPLQPELVEEMAARFFPDDYVFQQVARARAEAQEPRPAADWQAEFLDRAKESA